MGAGGHGFSFKNKSNTQINNSVAAKAAARPSPVVRPPVPVRPPVVEEVVNLNPTPFASTIPSPVISAPEPVEVMNYTAEPDPVAGDTGEFNMEDWYSGYVASGAYQEAWDAAREKYRREAEDEEDAFSGEFRGYGTGTGGEGYATDRAGADVFVSKIKEEQPPLFIDTVKEFEIDYPYGYDTSKLYMKGPDTGYGTSAHFRHFDDYGAAKNLHAENTGTYVDISGGEAPVGSYSMIWVEDPPESSLFEKALNFAPFRAAAAYLSKGYSEAVIAAGKGINGETLHFSDWLSLATAGVQLANNVSSAQTTVQAAETAEAAVNSAIETAKQANKQLTAYEAQTIYDNAYNAARGSTVAGINLADIADFGNSLGSDAFQGDIEQAVQEVEDLAAGEGAGTIVNLTDVIGDTVGSADSLSEVIEFGTDLFDAVSFQEEIDEEVKLSDVELQEILNAQQPEQVTVTTGQEEAPITGVTPEMPETIVDLEPEFDVEPIEFEMPTDTTGGAIGGEVEPEPETVAPPVVEENNWEYMGDGVFKHIETGSTKQEQITGEDPYVVGDTYSGPDPEGITETEEDSFNFIDIFPDTFDDTTGVDTIGTGDGAGAGDGTGTGDGTGDGTGEGTGTRAGTGVGLGSATRTTDSLFGDMLQLETQIGATQERLKPFSLAPTPSIMPYTEPQAQPIQQFLQQQQDMQLRYQPQRMLTNGQLFKGYDF